MALAVATLVVVIGPSAVALPSVLRPSVALVEGPDSERQPEPPSEWIDERESRMLARGTATRPDFGTQLTYIGRDRLLSFNQWTGEYALWRYERSQLNRCDALSWPPVVSGRWPSLIYKEFVFVGWSHLLILDPLTGDLQLSQCDDIASPSTAKTCQGEKLSCSPLHRQLIDAPPAGEAVPDVLGARSSPTPPLHSLVYLGGSLLLHYDRATGAYAMRTYDRCAASNVSAPCGLSAPLRTGALGYCVGAGEWPCAHHSSCADCLSSAVCGWCGVTRTCMAGSRAAPLQLSCPANYRYDSCSASGAAGGNATLTPF